MGDEPKTEPKEAAPPAELDDLDVSAEEADAVKGGTVSSKAPSGKPIGH
jgi:hypothetical protein